LTVGWLTHIKGTDLVPKIAALIFAKHPDWRWRVIGKGIEKESLINEIRQNGLSQNVQIIEPVSPNMEHEYNNAALYVMTSKFECFPMVLLEAMSHGLPVVAFDCPTGPAHIINSGEDGILTEAENVVAIATAVIELIEHEQKRKTMGANARKNIQRFSPEAIYTLWERTLGIG
ncbi:MAG TPA: glycosyltransferase, partial [Flavisolibacter sp.]|nr:glycosyltransferase [Flavisolibacter sp.]